MKIVLFKNNDDKEILCIFRFEKKKNNIKIDSSKQTNKQTKELQIKKTRSKRNAQRSFYESSIFRYVQVRPHVTRRRVNFIGDAPD